MCAIPFSRHHGAVDYLNIVEKRGLCFNMAIQTASSQRRLISEYNSDRKLANPAIVPGWDGPWTRARHTHLCDGSYDSFCGKEEITIVCFMQMTTVGYLLR
jgi:hypothetical protein